MTTASTAVYAVLGWPVDHSLSPPMHTAAFRLLGLDAAYLALPVEPARLGEALRGLEAAGVAGLNLTVPHKEAAAALLEDLEPLARALGAVNTLYRGGDGRFRGANTDVPGLERALRRERVRVARRRAAVVGAGGAGLAATVALCRLGAAEVTVLNRTEDRAAALVARLRSAGLSGETRLAWGGLAHPALESAGVLVQATSVGLDGRGAPLPAEVLPERATVVDLAYCRGGTPLLRAAGRRGLRTVDGVGMLVHQGALALELWTGRRLRTPAITAMTRVVRRGLGPPPRRRR